MKFSTRARYGLRLTFLMGLSYDRPVSLSTLAKQTDLSEKYLGQLLIMLRKGGVAASVRGAEGGYYLTRPPAEITIKSVLEAVDDGFEVTDCATSACPDDYCPNRRIFRKLYEGIDGILSSTTVQNMIDDYRCV